MIHETDVLVVGSGPGGLAAAIAAARCGVQVTLLERFGCFGGNITVVGVEGFAWYRHEATVEAGGIGWEFEQRAKEMGAAVPESQSLNYELDSEVSLCPKLLDIPSMLSGGFKDAFRTPEKLTAVRGCIELIDRLPCRREIRGLRKDAAQIRSTIESYPVALCTEADT
ncbi:hypothetical protein TW80_13430 [Loktanella sp. S4079]|nr:hypothetical protein TW80_13430 [Loktanella sp. S4079]